MSIDLSGLPVLPDTGTIRTDARRVADCGTRVAERGKDMAAAWHGIQGNYLAPEQETVYGAMDKVIPFTDETGAVTQSIRSALDAFADTVDALRPRFEALRAAVAAFSCAAPAEDETEDLQAEMRLRAELQALINEFRAAEDACAAAIAKGYLIMPEAPGPMTSWYYALGTGLVDHAAQSIHRHNGRTFRIVLHPGSNQRARNIDGSYTIRINRRPAYYFSRDTFMAPAIAALGHRALNLRIPELREPVVSSMARRPPGPGGRPALVPDVPGWAKKGSNALGAVDVGVTIYSNAVQQWNEDQLAHPEYGTWERVGSAAKNVGFEGGGALAGAAAGTAIGATVGSFIPIPVVGTVVGAAVGGWIGGSVGEGIGSFLKERSEGKGWGEAAKEGVKEMWDSLW